MKVAIIHNHPIHYKHVLFQELKRQGLDFEVIFGAAQSSIRHEKIELDPNLYRSRVACSGPYEGAPKHERVKQTWRSLQELGPEIVIISGYHMAEGWAAWLWAHLHGRSTVMWYESNEFDYPNRPAYKEILKRIFIRGLDRAHVYGISNKAYLVRLGMRADQVDVKRAVANVNIFATRPEERTYSERRAKHLLYVGRLSEEKNAGLILRAMAAAGRKSGEELLTLTIAGVGPLEKQLRGLCADLGIAHLVEFTGYCPQAELPRLYRSADLFILPSTREPWGLVALEAMLCRVPVAISTQCGCAADVVSLETGWQFSPWSEEPLTQLLVELQGKSGDELRTMGDACYELASQYSAAACAERIIASLREFVASAVGVEPAPGVGQTS